MPAKPALTLPDALVVRYFRVSELELVTDVTTDGDAIRVQLVLADGTERIDTWRDLGGGIGYVPSGD
jgi:hypothetical protein